MDPVIELRQYLLRPGARDTLIQVFDEHFVEGQEKYGSHIVGQFRDLDRPDRYVWLRGFPDLATRKEALAGFYGGPIWREHSAVANGTMIDSGNALLLEPVEPGPRYPRPGDVRPPLGSTEVPPSVVAGTIYHRRSPADDFAGFFAQEIRPELDALDVQLAGTFQTLAVDNNFPALPLRYETVFGWLAVFASDEAFASYLAASADWRSRLAPEIQRLSIAPQQDLQLRPTARSQLR